MPARRESKTQSYSAALPNRRSKCAQPTRRGNTLPVIAGGSILPRATLSRNRPDAVGAGIGDKEGKEGRKGMVMHAVSRDRLDIVSILRSGYACAKLTVRLSIGREEGWAEWKIFRSRAIAPFPLRR